MSGKAERLVELVMEELSAIEPGATEAMEFWKSRKHHHYLYYRARRDLMRDINRVLELAIHRVFTEEELTKTEDAHTLRKDATP